MAFYAGDRLTGTSVGGGGAFTFQSGFSGSVNTTHGGSQTIAVASGFGTKSTAAPRKYDDFSSGTNGANVANGWTLDTSGSNPPTYSSTQLRHARNTMSARANWTNPEYLSAFGLTSAAWVASGVFVDAWIYFDLDGNQGAGDYPRNVKPFWLNGAAGNPSVFFPAFWEPSFAAGGVLDQNGAASPFNNTNQSTFYFASPDADYLLDNWRHVQFWGIQSSSDTLNGTFHLAVDQSVKVNTTAACSRFASGGNAAWNSMYIGGYLGHDFVAGQGGPFAFDGRAYYSDVYIDDTRQRVEIGDNATYSACAHREIQLPTAWTDSSISFTLKQGSFSSISGLYLFVVNTSGVATLIGSWS